MTVTKVGDALDGMTLKIDPSSFPSATTLSISSQSNTSLPTGNGIVAISPRTVISSNQSGYANAPLTLRVPVKVPASTVPVVAMFDSASGQLEPLLTLSYDSASITVLVRHLNGKNIGSKVTASIATKNPGVSLSVARDEAVLFDFGVFAIPAAVLDRDYDTGFLPGRNDWAFRPIPTTPSPTGILGGALLTELWYFNSNASPGFLRDRFGTLSNVEMSSRLGLRWSTVTDKALNTGIIAYLSAVYTGFGVSPSPKAIRDRDANMLRLIRAGFALSAMNGARAVPTLVNVMKRNQGEVEFEHLLIAYRVEGNQVFVADAAFPGDASRRLVFNADAGMSPYVAGQLTLTEPIVMQLGQAAPVSEIASGYQQIISNTVGDNLFQKPVVASWFGAAYDTVFVVDTLRLWVECFSCTNGFTTTLQPRPVSKLGNAFRIYKVRGTAAYDSSGSLGSNGVLIDANSVTTGTDLVLGLPLGTAETDGIVSAGSSFIWNDYRQITLRRLAITNSPVTQTAKVDEVVPFSITASTALLPPRYSYRWSFSDGTPVVNTANVATTTHKFSIVGTYAVTGEIIDERNTQVIARAKYAITVNPNTLEYSAWKIIPGAASGAAPAPLPDATSTTRNMAISSFNEARDYWSQAAAARERMLWYVPVLTNIDGDQFIPGLYYTDADPGAPSGPFVPFGIANVPDPSAFEDPVTAWTWTASGTPPANVTLATRYRKTFPSLDIGQPCLGQDVAPIAYMTTSFNMAGATATGTIVYTFREFKPSCLRPRGTISSWTLTIPFTATRVR